MESGTHIQFPSLTSCMFLVFLSHGTISLKTYLFSSVSVSTNALQWVLSLPYSHLIPDTAIIMHAFLCPTCHSDLLKCGYCVVGSENGILYEILILATLLLIYSYQCYLIFNFYPHPRTSLLILEREKERGREMERNIDVREKHQSVPLHTCPNWD